MNENNFQFAHPEHLYALILVGVCAIFFVCFRIIRKRQIKQLVDTNLIPVILPDYSSFRKSLRFVVASIATIFIILAWAQPQFGVKKQEVKKKGIEIAIALDVSNSMLAEDIKPNRIEKAKFSIQKILNKLDNNKISIITFAGESYIQLPMTSDVGSAKLFLQTISPQSINKQGTAIGSAISKCMRSFSGNEKTSKAIIVISDGENHEDDAIGEAKRAKEKGIIVSTVGMGTTSGVPIPIRNKYTQTNFLMNKDGQPVTTKLNEEMLQKIAEAGGGIYSREDFAPILKTLDSLEKSEFESQNFNVYEERFQIFLMIGIVCLFIESCILERRNKWLKNINIFKIKTREYK